MSYIDKFDAKRVKDRCVGWIRTFFEKNGPGCNAIIGISGGKDSSVVAALCVEALGADRVIGVLMPNGEQSDIEDSKRLVEHLGIKNITVDISHAVNGVVAAVRIGAYAAGWCDGMYELSAQTMTNLPARIRMATLYAISQSNNGRVANTCNLSEDYIGYSTRYGDAAGDFSPLARLTTEEVIMIGEECGLPKDLTRKTPSDGLCGKTDEDNLGFTYKVLNEYIRDGKCDDSELEKRFQDLNLKNAFKLYPMPFFDYTYYGKARNTDFNWSYSE